MFRQSTIQTVRVSILWIVSVVNILNVCTTNKRAIAKICLRGLFERDHTAHARSGLDLHCAHSELLGTTELHDIQCMDVS